MGLISDRDPRAPDYQDYLAGLTPKSTRLVEQPMEGGVGSYWSIELWDRHYRGWKPVEKALNVRYARDLCAERGWDVVETVRWQWTASSQE